MQFKSTRTKLTPQKNLEEQKLKLKIFNIKKIQISLDVKNGLVLKLPMSYKYIKTITFRTTFKLSFITIPILIIPFEHVGKKIATTVAYCRVIESKRRKL